MKAARVKKKGKWKNPKLIVLSHDRSAEQVLLFCKNGQTGQGPQGWFGACTFTLGYVCSAWTAS